MQDSSPWLQTGGDDVTASHQAAVGGAAEGEPAPRLQLPSKRWEPTSGELSG
jgi:hypothetical protein